ncbi:MAG TPA: NAD(P)/FAD-dependent oxidoreductase [Gammaproteobacteria bacterium]
MNDNDNRILISGAGLAGSLLAVMFARRGFDVTIYEKRGDMRTTETSAGRSINLALAARGIRALEHADVMDRVRPLMIPMPGRVLHPVDGELKYQPYGSRRNEVNYSVSRAELNKALMNAAEGSGKVRILFNHEVQDIDFGRNALIVKNTATGDAFEDHGLPVFAADGAGSPVRQAMARRLGIEASEDILDHAYKELVIPPAADGGFRIEKNALHIWPRGGYMLIALPNLDGSFTCTLFLARDGEPSFASLGNEDTLRAFFAGNFPDALQLMPGLERDFFDNPTGMLGTVRCRPWHHGSEALLLGDAAHAIVPFHGQGMNAAFEDCVALDRLIEVHGTDWNTVFAAFTAERKPDADAIAQMALENYIEMRDAVRDPGFHLRKQVEFALEEKFPGRFIPRYSMVMFHPEIRYADALKRGERQSGILAELTEGRSDISAVDLGRANELLARHGL